MLVLADDPALRHALLDALTGAGYRADDVPDALRALTSFDRSEPPDVLVTELALPGLSGTELIDIARRRWVDLPVVAIGDEEATRDGADLLAPHAGVLFLRRSFEPAELVAAVEEVLRWRATR